MARHLGTEPVFVDADSCKLINTNHVYSHYSASCRTI